jgi:hypothetical protein
MSATVTADAALTGIRFAGVAGSANALVIDLIPST